MSAQAGSPARAGKQESPEADAAPAVPGAPSIRFPWLRGPFRSAARAAYAAFLGAARLAAIPWWRVGQVAIRVGVRRRCGPFRLRLQPGDNVISRAIWLRGHWEPRELQGALRWVEPGSVAVDVGANIGTWALPLARAVGPEGLVVACEPEPSSFALLADNASANGCRNVVAFPVACSDAAGLVGLTRSRANGGGHSMVGRNVGDPSAVVPVPALPLDSLLAFLGERRVGFIKMDVQGYEGQVLLGAARTLARHRPVVLLEFGAEMLRNAGTDPEGLLRGLAERSYNILRQTASGDWQPLDLRRDRERLARGEHNLLAVPAGR